jgi:purine nucleosidase
MSRPIIIDTDPGHDDALAILLALASPELDVVGLSTVGGNVGLRHTTNNALRLVELAGRRDLPVHAGCDRPLVLSATTTASEIHGVTGLDNCGLPPPSRAENPEHAVDFIIAQCLNAPAEGMTLCPIGPFTNIAMAMVKEPAIVPRIREIVLMGGSALDNGNVTQAAEFNVYADPHAAHVVFTAGAPIVMLPLDCTHKVVTTAARLAQLTASDSRVSRSVHGMLSFYHRNEPARYGEVGSPLHDPCVIAYLLQPDLFSGRDCWVNVDLTPGISLGKTWVDWWNRAKQAPNALVLRDIDAEGFYALLAERLARFHD